MPDTTVSTARYGTVVTATGAAKIAAGILSGEKINITHAAVGDGGGAYYMPTAAQTALLRECWRGEIASAAINAENENMIDVKFIVPAEVGGFTVREAALIDADGDVIAICNTPDAEKVAVTAGVSFPLTMMIHIIVTDASAVNVTVNPSLDVVSREYLDQRLSQFADGVGSAVLVPITIPAAGWAAATDTTGLDGYTYTVDVAVPEALDAHFPTAALDIPSLAPAGAAGLCPTIMAGDGFLRFWAQAIPTADLTGTVLLRSQNLYYTGTSTGGDIATDDEVDDTLDDVFGDDAAGDAAETLGIATDGEVEEMLTDVFGDPAENE